MTGEITMRIIGLTGGIASGKSTVSRILQSMGAVAIDADAIAHELAEPGAPLYEAYITHWGAGILTPEGTLDRRKIGDIVFADEDERRWLDDVSHPLLYREVQRRLVALRTSDVQTVVLDAPLLFEAGWERLADETWVVVLPRDIQIRRLMARNHYTEEEALSRMESQLSQEEKMRRADVVIDNRGSEAQLEKKVQEAFRRPV